MKSAFLRWASRRKLRRFMNGPAFWGSLGFVGSILLYRFFWRRTAAPEDSHAVWRFEDRPRQILAGRDLRIELPAPAIVHWTADNWRTVHDTNTAEKAPGVHAAYLPTAQFPPGSRVLFTFFWPRANQWEGADFAIHLESVLTTSAG